MSKFDILAIGHLNNDYIIEVEKFAKTNSSKEIKNLKIYDGGTAANVALVAAQLGLNTGFVSPIGSEFIGTKYFEKLKKNDNCLAILKPIKDETTSTCFVFTDKNENQKSYIYDGASKYFNTLDVPSEHIDEAEIVHITTAPPEYAIKCAKYAQENKKIVSFAPGQQLHYYTDDQILEILQYTNIVFCNEYEHKYIYKICDPFDYQIALLIKTMGAKGSEIYCENDMYWEISPVSAEVVDPTGAGDSYAAAFLCAYLYNVEILTCGTFASAVASFIVEKKGCQTNMPTMEDVKKRIGELSCLDQ